MNQKTPPREGMFKGGTQSPMERLVPKRRIGRSSSDPVDPSTHSGGSATSTGISDTSLDVLEKKVPKCTLSTE